MQACLIEGDLGVASYRKALAGENAAFFQFAVHQYFVIGQPDAAFGAGGYAAAAAPGLAAVWQLYALFNGGLQYGFWVLDLQLMRVPANVYGYVVPVLVRRFRQYQPGQGAEAFLDDVLLVGVHPQGDLCRLHVIERAAEIKKGAAAPGHIHVQQLIEQPFAEALVINIGVIAEQEADLQALRVIGLQLLQLLVKDRMPSAAVAVEKNHLAAAFGQYGFNERIAGSDAAAGCQETKQLRRLLFRQCKNTGNARGVKDVAGFGSIH